MVPVMTNGSWVTALIGSTVVGPAGIATVSVLPVDCAMACFRLGTADGPQRSQHGTLQHVAARKCHGVPPVSLMATRSCLASAIAPTAITMLP